MKFGIHLGIRGPVAHTATLRTIPLEDEELGLSYVLKPIGPRTGETQTKEFTSLNRKQKIPLMQIGEFHLSESLAICKYLQR